MARPQLKNSFPGVIKFKMLLDPSLIIITIYYPGVDEIFCQKYINFTHFSPKITSPYIYNVLSHYTIVAPYQIC
mgnify:CR=1 FL=1